MNKILRKVLRPEKTLMELGKEFYLISGREDANLERARMHAQLWFLIQKKPELRSMVEIFFHEDIDDLVTVSAKQEWGKSACVNFEIDKIIILNQKTGEICEIIEEK